MSASRNTRTYFCQLRSGERDSLIFRCLISPNGFLFRTVFIPKGFYSKRLFLQTVFSPLIRKAYNLKGHCSENFNSEMPLFRTVLKQKGFIQNGFYPERFLIRTVLILKGRFSEIRNKNLSDQKPFRSKRLYDVKNSPELSYSPGFSPIAMAAYGSYFP